MNTDGFYPAPFDFRFEDVWPLCALRISAMRAYKLLHQQNHIIIRYPVLVFRDRLLITYESQLPREWTLSMLKEAEDELVEKERFGVIPEAQAAN